MFYEKFSKIPYIKPRNKNENRDNFNLIKIQFEPFIDIKGKNCQKTNRKMPSEEEHTSR